MSKNLLLPTALLFAAFGPAPARGAESFDGCAGFIDALPATIATQGVWCLRADLTSNVSSGPALTIGTNNVTIDCNDHTIVDAAAPGGLTRGIYAFERTNVAVRRCHVAGFVDGIVLLGSGIVAEANTVDGSGRIGLQVSADAGLIRRNVVGRIGDAGASQTMGIYVTRATDVVDNEVDGVTGQFPVGIYSDAISQGAILRNRVRGIAAAGTTLTQGISTVAGSRWLIADNHVVFGYPATPASTNNFGIGCGNGAQNVTRDNTVVGWDIGFFNCVGGVGNLVAP